MWWKSETKLPKTKRRLNAFDKNLSFEGVECGGKDLYIASSAQNKYVTVVSLSCDGRFYKVEYYSTEPKGAQCMQNKKLGF